MKKNLVLVAVLGSLILTGCSKSENIITENDFQQEIALDGFMHKMTKAPIANGAFTSTEYTMHVSADVYGGSNYFKNKSFTYQTSKWKATPALYWPNTGALDFLVWVGKTTSSVASAADAAWTNADEVVLTVSNNKTAQEDILFGAAPNQTWASGGTNISVKHAQSLIAFQAKTNATDVVVTSIKFTPKYSGTCTISASTPSAAWTNLANAAETEILSAGMELTKDAEYEDAGSAILVPAQSAVAITVTYKVNGVETKATIPDTAVTAPTASTWDVNYKYIYQLNISVHEIEFNVSVTDWTGGTTTEQTI